MILAPHYSLSKLPTVLHSKITVRLVLGSGDFIIASSLGIEVVNLRLL